MVDGALGVFMRYGRHGRCSKAASRSGLLVLQVAGPSGSGKTQWALTSACRVLIDQPSSHVLYIDSEARQLAAAASSLLQSQLLPSLGAERAMTATTQALDRLHISTITNSSDLMTWCAGLESTCLQHNVKLVIIDSIATAVKGCTDAIQRQKVLMQLATQLKLMGEGLQFAVLVTNQVRLAAGSAASAPSSTSAEGDEAELGIAWSHAINTRLMLSQSVGGGASSGACSRAATLTKCPCAPRASVPFAITGAGVMLPADAASMGYDLT